MSARPSAGRVICTHPRHRLSVSKFFEPLASSQVNVEHIFGRHGGLEVAKDEWAVKAGQKLLITAPGSMGKRRTYLYNYARSECVLSASTGSWRSIELTILELASLSGRG